MTFKTTEGERVWVNPRRVDSMKETVDAQGEKVVRIRAYGDTYVVTDDFDDLAERLEKSK